MTCGVGGEAPPLATMCACRTADLLPPPPPHVCMPAPDATHECVVCGVRAGIGAALMPGPAPSPLPTPLACGVRAGIGVTAAPDPPPLRADIDAIVARGEEDTRKLNEKMVDFTEKASKFTLDGGISLYDFKDEDEEHLVGGGGGGERWKWGGALCEGSGGGSER